MLSQQTIDKLHVMKLNGMAKGFKEDMERGDATALSFEERFGILVDREWDVRQSLRISKRIKTARLKLCACVEDIDYHHPRGLDRGVMQDILSCRWIQAKRNIILIGATGLGKSWLGCAFAEKACREGYTALYTRVPRLIHEINVSKADGSFLKFLSKLARVDLLLLDDWGIHPLEGEEQHDILEVLDDRVGSRSTLITSQIPVNKWHDMIGDPTVADAILDRLVQNAIQINLRGESMRKEKT